MSLEFEVEYFFKNLNLLINLLKIKLLIIKLEKTKVKIYDNFIKFHKSGLSVHISKGLIPYVIIISSEMYIG